MSLLQRMKLLHTRDDDEPAAGPLAKAAGHDGSQDFAIKALPAARPAGERAPGGRTIVRIHATASPPAVPGLGLGPIQPENVQQEGQHQDQLKIYGSADLHTTPSAPADLRRAQAAAKAAAVPAPQQPIAPPPLRGYRSLAQFSSSQELYRSSQSVVLKAQCIATRQPVILKQYFKKKMSSRAVHKMKREVALMYRLRGEPGVCQILGDFQDEKHFCIVMEFYPGGDLYKRAMVVKGDKTLSQQWICSKVIAPLLRVLNVLHNMHGIVHRDIKPENIFLSADDELMLGDFGLAIQQQSELPFLKAGTLDYMAPEVVQNPLVDCIDECPEYGPADLKRHGFQPYTEKVDVWAVGVLAYELMMQGETPFYHDEPAETEKLILKCDLVEVKFPRHMLLSPWADFVRTTLQVDPARRPSAAQLLRHRWVQMHLQARLRPPLHPHRTASIMAALDRSASMPPLALAADCAAAVAGLAAPAAALAGRLRLQPTSTPAPSPAGSSAAALHMLADLAAASVAEEEGAEEAAAAEAAAEEASAGLATDPSNGSNDGCRCTGLTAVSGRKCSHCLAGGASGSMTESSTPSSPSPTPSPGDAEMADAAGSPQSPPAAAVGGGWVLPPGMPARAESDPEMEFAPGKEPPRRKVASMSLPLPRELAAMRMAPLGPPLLGPARAPTPAELTQFALVPQLALASLQHPPGEAGGLARKPSRLGLSSFTAGGSDAAGLAAMAARAAPVWMGTGPMPAMPGAAAAAAAGLVLPGPQSLRRMGRTGSVFRPPLPRGVPLDSPTTPRSPSSGGSPGAGGGGSPGGSPQGADPMQSAGNSPGEAGAAASGRATGNATRSASPTAGRSSGERARHSEVRMARSGQRNRLVAYLRRQTASAVGLMRRLRVSKRSVSAGDDGGSSSGSEGGASGAGSPMAPDSLSE
ncbi:hypothetical protein ABPG75_010464 [Micractinium tetrahymenae]